MAVRALPVEHVGRLPNGVPMEPKTHYFRFQKSGPYWDAIGRSLSYGGLCAHRVSQPSGRTHRRLRIDPSCITKTGVANRMSIVYTSACFGKVPSFGDFVRVDASGADMRAFDVWIQNGLRHMLSQGIRLSTLGQASTFGFVYGTGPHTPMLLGLLKPSRDSVGRHYPLYITATCGSGS